MPLLEDEKKKFFDFLDNLLKEGYHKELAEHTDSGKEEIPSHLFEDMKGGAGMPEDDKRLEELEAKIKELSEARDAEKKSLEDAFNTNLDSVKKELEDKHKSELEIANKRLEETEKKLSEREVSFHNEIVDKKISELVSNGIWPAVAEKAKRVMLADIGDSFSKIKLEDKEEASEMSLSDVIYDILDTIPADARIDLSEVSKSDKNKKNTKYLSDAEVLEYAKKNDMNYEDACAILSEEGKIEHI